MRRQVLAVVALAWCISPAAAACESMVFAGDSYTVCRVDLTKDSISLFNVDLSGTPYGSFTSLSRSLAAEGKSLVFAMNGGMFDEDLKPIGLYVENGRQQHKVNRRNGSGNFHLKPNGIFYVKGDRAGVLETEAFLRSGIKPDHATQSGPMLVIDGSIHPKFSESGPSRKRRNGVCVPSESQVVFAISDGLVNFHAFATLFRDGLHCENALFLDGSVSSLFAPELSRGDGFFELGPIIAVVR